MLVYFDSHRQSTPDTLSCDVTTVGIVYILAAFLYSDTPVSFV